MRIEVAKDMRLFVEDRGQGKPIVFLHAWCLSHRFWENQVAALSDRYRTIAFDQRGHGQSDKGNVPYTIDAYAEDLHHLLIKLDLKDVTLVGWSMGVTVALQYMHKFGGERVSKLGLTNNGPFLIKSPDWPHGFAQEEVAGLGAALANDRAQTTEDFYGGLLGRKSKARIDWITRTCLDVPLAVAMQAFQSELATDHRPHLKAIKTPTLVLAGDQDHPAGIGGARYLAENIPNAKLVVFPGSGHFPMLEDSGAYSQALASFIA